MFVYREKHNLNLVFNYALTNVDILNNQQNVFCN